MQRSTVEAPTDQKRTISAATLSIRQESINEEERSVEAVLASENPVRVFDMDEFRIIDEVLLMDGMRPADDLPLLANHQRFSLDDVLGSIRDLRTANGELNVRLFFADLSSMADDEEARRVERSWIKVRQRHQRQVSLGYRVHEAITISPNKTEIVNGRRYTAGSLPLRVATDWTPREGSLTPIGADEQAKIRREAEMQHTDETRGEKLAAELESLICAQETDEYTRSDIISDMSEAAGVSEADVDEVLNVITECPAWEQLEGFARALDTSVDRLVDAAEADGFSYST